MLKKLHFSYTMASLKSTSQSQPNVFRGRATRVEVGGCPDLLCHGLLRRDRERQEDQVRGPVESHWRNHGTPDWVLHHQWGRDHLLFGQIYLQCCQINVNLDYAICISSLIVVYQQYPFETLNVLCKLCES